MVTLLLGLKRNVHVDLQWERNLEMSLVESKLRALECWAQDFILKAEQSITPY